MLARSIFMSLGTAALLVGLTACTENVAEQPGAPATCTNYSLSASNPRVALVGETPVWGIRNSGPASVVIQTMGDPTFGAVFAPRTGDGAPQLFVGDDAYEYTLGLVDVRGTAAVQICHS